jgi:subtilisin family serine protease
MFGGIVRIMDQFSESDHKLIEQIRDPITGAYFTFSPKDSEDNLKHQANLYLLLPQFQHHQLLPWPLMKEQFQATDQPSNYYTAVLDTGVMSSHPRLRGCIAEAVDFTGEGTEDQNGHGTVVALTLRETSLLRPRIISVKILQRDGIGLGISIVKAFDWLVDFAKKNGAVVTANISAGVYSKKWGLIPCKGDCRVCKAAINAAQHGIITTAAAGNTKGITACPARVGLEGNNGILAVGGYDLPQSGTGEVSTSGKIYRKSI